MGLTREHRRSLLDQIDPGDRQLKAGLILSYSADAAPLIAILSMLAGHSLVGEEPAEKMLQDRFRIMRDIESLAQRMRILINVGGLRTPGGSGDRMAALLDSVVREIVPKKDDKPNPESSFHPKILLLEYEAPIRDVRMFICTRNVTTDNSMDAMVSLRVVAKSSQTDNGERMCEFFHAALAESDRQIPSEIKNLVSGLKQMDLEPLHSFFATADIKFYGQIPGGKTLSDLVSIPTSGVSERLIISPFIDKTTLKSFLPTGEPTVTLLSELRDYKKICSQQDGDKFLAKNFDCYEINRNGDQSFHSLHAKMILDKTSKETTVIVGSANATTRAWTGANWEAVIKFTTSAAYFKKTYDDLFVDNESENRAALCMPFVPVPEEWEKDTPGELFTHLISRAPLEYSFEVKGSNVAVKASLEWDSSNGELKGISFHVLGEAESHLARFVDGFWTLSWDVPIASFSSILAINATFSSSGVQETIRINRCLEVDPELLSQRNQKLLAELVETQGIHEILSAILEGVGFDLTPIIGDDGGASWTAGKNAGLPVANLEALTFLYLKTDRESLAKRALISDIMRTEFSEIPMGINVKQAAKHRKLFELVKKIWLQLEAEFPGEAR